MGTADENMIYTVGKVEIYEAYMDRDPDAAKGISGSVWETFEEAKAYRDLRAPAFRLYGVEADWENDAKDIGEAFRYLTNPGKLFKLDQNTGELTPP